MHKKTLVSYFIVVFVNMITLKLGFWDFDFGDYSVQMKNLLSGHFFLDKGQIIHRYPPLTSLLYAIFIKIFHSKILSIFIFHNLLAILVLFFGKKIINLFVKTESFFLGNLDILLILNPFVYSFVLRGVNSELIFIFFNMFVLYYSIKLCTFKIRLNKHIFIIALVIGLAILTRSQGIALLISTSVFLFVFKKYKSSVLILLYSILTILPWQIYLESKDHFKFNTIISSGGLYSFRDGLTFNNKTFRTKIKLPDEIEDFSSEFYKRYYLEKNQTNSEYKFTVTRFQQSPSLLIKLVIFKFSRCFYGTDSQNEKIELINKFIVSFFILFNLYIFFNLNNMSNDYKYIFLLLIFYLIMTVLMSVLALSILRYQIPVFVLILTLDLAFLSNHYGKK